MNRFTVFLAVTMLSIALLATCGVQAMEIRKFDQLADADQDEYVADLIIGAQRILKDDGRPDVAEHVHRLFTEKDPQANVSTGMMQLDLLLDRARVADLERINKDPTAPRLEVEHAMILTLKKNGIEVPASFMHVMDGFRPKHPPR